MVSSAVYPGLERKPGGPDNWVERAKGLPKYIERIAKHLHYEQGYSISRAIATAVNTVKRWARGGTVLKHGMSHRVTAATVAKSAAAVAQWYAKRLAGRINLSDIDLSEELDESVAFDLLRIFQEPDTGAGKPTHGRMPLNVASSKGPMNVDLAVPRSELTVEKRKQRAKSGQAMPDGKFPIFDRTSLKSAIGLARTPSQRMHVCRRAKALGLDSMIPDSWPDYSLSEKAVQVIDLASTIAPKHAGNGKASDGRRSYKRQGKWGHGFVPLDRAAKEAKAKGSPIAIKRLDRLYKSGKRTQGAGTGRAGGRSGLGRKDNSETTNIDEKGIKEKAQSVGRLRNARFDPATRRKQSVAGGVQKGTSKQTRIAKRARQNWDEIPAHLKTVRNGKRYVQAVFGGKNVLTEWIGGINEIASDPDKTKTMRSVAPQELAKMTPTQIRKMLKNPKTTGPVRKQLNAELRRQLKKVDTRG
jgi:hypothetical protein